MVNETELAQLDAIVQTYGLVETVLALADICEERTKEDWPTSCSGIDWAIDAMKLRRDATFLINGRNK